LKPVSSVVALACVAVLLAVVPAEAHSPNGCRHAKRMPARLSKVELRQSVACLVNARRRAHGLAALREVRSLRRAASGHSKSMVADDFFSHYSLSGASFLTRIRRSGYLAGAGSYYVGEVIATGTGRMGTPRAIVRAWMGSAGHRANLLSSRFRHMGVGVAHGSPGAGRRGATFTIDLGTRG
jgi:uncharacterized protein YkwD